MKRDRKLNGGLGLGLGLGFEDGCKDVNGTYIISSSSESSPSSSSSSIHLKQTSTPVAVGIVGTGAVGGLSYIEHQVSKFDTLAGVAIKYGVEVADIKRLNGLVSDRQMFALKTLQIPLPGRHPPSPILSNGVDEQRPGSSEKTPSKSRHSDLFDSFQSLKLKASPQRNASPAMNNLQGYYGLKPVDRKPVPEGFEMGLYRKGGGGGHKLEDGPFASALSTPPRLHRKSRSVASDLMSENSDLSENGSAENAGANNSSSDKWMEKLQFRRRQKSEADFSSKTPETMLLKEESINGGGGFSSITGKGLALRPKSASRMGDSETETVNPVPVGLGDSFITESSSINGVRKSPSTSSLQDSDSMTLAYLWPLNLKPDLQAFATASITKPIFDGLQKPMSGRKTKAALD